MAVVTVGGGINNPQSPLPASQVLVTTLTNISQLATSIAGAAMSGINANTVSGAVSVVGSAGGAQTINGLPSTVTGVVVENTYPTTISNQGGPNNETIFSGIFGLNFTDYNSSDTIVAGGGVNNIVFAASSSNGLYVGDAINSVTVAATGGVTTVVGTLQSTDTIIGTSTRGAGIYYQAGGGSKAFIDPGADNATIVGIAGGTEAVSVFGGLAFTGSVTVTGGTGYFQGGTGGNNSITSSVVGSTTMIGGGTGDVITSNGYGDVIVGGLGAETLQSAGTAGGVKFYADGATGNATVSTTINMHTGQGTVGNTLLAGNPTVTSWTSGVENVTINDFISGHDKFIITSAVVGTATVTNSGGNTIVTTSNHSTFTFVGVTLQSSDIIRH